MAEEQVSKGRYIMKCRLCDSDNVKIIHKGVRDNTSIDVLKCQSCGLVFLSSTSHIADDFYQDGGMHSEEDTEKRFMEWRKETYVDDKRRYDRFVNEIGEKSIIDFGCGNGGLLKLFKEGGKRTIYGVELENSARERIISDGINVRSDIDEFDEDFDYITSFHVIEHLVEPDEWLEKIRKHMTPESMLCIETPNADDALLTLYNCHAFADFTYWSCHVVLYNLDTLCKLLEKNRFKIVKREQIQRYPLANHLYWLSSGKPGGQNIWNFISNHNIDEEYAKLLEKKNICDTIMITCVIDN